MAANDETSSMTTAAQPENHDLDEHTPVVDMKSLGKVLTGLPSYGDDELLALRRLTDVVRQLSTADAAFYFQYGSTGLTEQPILSQLADTDVLSHEIQHLAKAAIREQGPQTARLSSDKTNVGLAVPVIRAEFPDEAIAVGLSLESADALPGIAQKLQLIAAFVAQWRGRDDRTTLDFELHLLRQLARLATTAERERGPENLAKLIANQMRQICDAETVAVVTFNSRRKLELAAVAPMSDFNRDSAHARDLCELASQAIEMLAADAELLDVEHGEIESELTLRLQQVSGCQQLRTVVLKDAREEPVAVVICIGNVEPSARSRWAIPMVSSQLGSQIALQRDAQSSIRPMLQRRIRAFASKRCKWQLLIPIAVLLASMLIPVPRAIKCNCVVEAERRRFLSAPYSGRLEKVFVAPGGIVDQGQLIARMDGEEISSKLARLQADYGRVQQGRRVVVASQDAAAAGEKRFELESLQSEIELLQKHQRDLEIRSPIRGVFAGEDLHKQEGASVTMGQDLGEIAQLESFVLEVAIPDDDISHVEIGQTVVARLDSKIAKPFYGELRSLQPRSEQIDGANVFIGVVQFTSLDDSSSHKVHRNSPKDISIAAMEIDSLRPGMKGRAKISAKNVFLGEKLFGKFWHNLRYRIGW